MKELKDFILPGSNDQDVNLANYKGKKVVIYFYPKDSTPGCTKEACAFRDNIEYFDELNTVIIGVSKDSMKRHKNFIDKNDLPFLLLSDEDGKLCEEFGVWQLKKMCGKEYMGIVRSTFLFDENGKLIKIWDKVKVKDHIPEVLDYIKNIK